MCGSYRDVNSVIQNGDMIVPLQFSPILWSEFLNDTEKSLALRELVYILERQDVTDDKSRFLYRSIFRHLVLGNKSKPDNGNYPIELKELVTTIPEEVKLQSTGVIIDAAMFFALFFLCKQLAAATGYANSEKQDYTLTLNNNLEFIFNKISGDDIVSERLIPESGNNNTEIHTRIVDTIYIPNQRNHAYNILYPLLGIGTTSDIVKGVKVLDPKLPHGSGWLDRNSSMKKNINELFKNKNFNIIQDYFQKLIDSNNLNSFESVRKQLIKCCTEEFYRLLQNIAIDESTPELQLKTFAVGDGSDTTGLLGIKNLGVILFSYDYQQNTSVMSMKTINIGTIKKNMVLHITLWGLNQNEGRIIKFTGRAYSMDWEMEFESSDMSSYRIKRKRYFTIPESYVSDSFDSLSDTLFIHNNRVIAVYKSTSKDLFFYEDCENVKFYVDGKGDEIFGFICVSENKNAHDYYEPDKFELTKAQIDVVLDDAMCELLLKKIKNGYRIKPDLEGDFVGKIPENTLTDSGYRNPENFVTDSEYNTMGSSKESSDPKYEQSTLRHSSLEMTEEKINGIDMVKLKITSHVSPRISRLDKYLNESQKQQYRIENYTVMSSDGEIYSYNPLLAVLRSMGFLEAIVKKLYQYNLNNGYNIDKHEFSEILNNARSFDKNATNRGLPDIYQISDPITYDIYNSMKWYKGDEDRYEHSINFNEN